jgi:hypothetical protein
MSEPAKRYYKTMSDNMHLQSENARLKAEVERLQSIHSIDSIGIEQLKAQVERLTFEIEVHREGWDSNDAWEYHCKFEVAKMYAKRDALKPDSDSNTPSTAV